MPSAARQYLAELIAQFPDAPARTLARIAYRDRGELWPNPTACLSGVRYLLGVKGKHHRQTLADRRFMRPPRGSSWSDVIPEALTQLPDWHAENIAGKHGCLILSDIHIPFHDPAALEAALEFGLKRKPTLVIINGDGVDHYAQSEYVKDPKLRDFAGEVLATKRFLAGLRKQFGKRCRIIYKHGNHEERFERYLRHKAPELLGVPDFDWASIFGLADAKIELVMHKRPLRLGKLNVIHGHEYNFAISNPVNAARGFFLRAKTHVMGGHFHQSSNHSEKSLDGHVVSTWSTGCLCELHPEYRPLNNWNHGFAWVDVDAKGVFHVENLRIIDGKVY